MALEKKIIGLPMAKGQNDKLSERVLPVGQLEEAKNVQFVKGGEVRKRKGFHSVSNDIPAIVDGDSARTVGTGKAIASYKDEVLVFDGRYAYTKTSTDDDWVNKGRIVGCTKETELVEAGTNMVQTNAQIAVANKFEVQVWSELDPTETISIYLPFGSCATAGGNLATFNFAASHNLVIGSRITIAFDSSDSGYNATHHTNGTYTVVSITDHDTVVVDFTKPFAGGSVVGAGTVTTGVAWRTYAKVVDNFTRTEIVAKTLVNVFQTANGMYNIPRAQVAGDGRYVWIFVHVGSGRIKYTKIDTGSGTGAISADLIPDLLENTSSGVLFSVDLDNPVWLVESCNNDSVTAGVVAFRAIDDAGTLKLRLSYFEKDGSGNLSEQGSPSPVTILTPHFPPTTIGNLATYPTEVYPGASSKGNIEVVGDLLLKAITPSDEDTADYIAVGYTLSGNKSGSSGSTDEPDGIKIRVYNHALALQGTEQTISIDGANTQFTNTDTPGFILVNGTAGKNEANKVRFFLTMAANKTNFRYQPAGFLVNAYDYTLTGSGALSDKNWDYWGLTVTSDCFHCNGDLYLGLGYATRPNNYGTSGAISSIFNTSVGLIVDHQGQAVAKTALSAGPWTHGINHRFIQYAGYNRVNCVYGVPRVHVESQTKFKFGTSRYSGVNTSIDGTDLTAMDAAVGILDFAPTRYLPSVEANGSLKVAGGILWDYSGDYFKEDNFFWHPEIVAADDAAGGLSGIFTYRAIYEWVDHNGKVQRSAPSEPLVTGNLSSKKVSVYIYNLHVTHKRDATTLLNPGGIAAVNQGARSEVKIVLYRTEASGSLYHRCAEVLMEYGNRYQIIEDNLSDADLVDNPFLYTTGGVAANICPPSQYDIALFKDRIFLATTENTVWFSKRFTEGRETGFSDDFAQSVDNKAEKIQAICPNLEHILILGEKNGYYMSGDGPSSTGAGPGFSPLRIFAPGQGAIEGTCRVETPKGVFFQTDQGLVLCGRNMQVSHKGAMIEDLITSTNYAIDGHVFDKDHEVRFLLAANKKIAVYNYLFDQWSHWELHADTGTNAASLVSGGTYYRLNTIGVVYEQQTGTYYDKVSSTNKPYAFSLTTGWINIGQLQQVGRVYRLLLLGDYNTASKPKVTFFSDYNKTHHHIIEAPSAPGTSKYQLHVKFPRQKIKSTRFIIWEDSPAAGGGYMAVQSMALLVGVKKPETSFKHATADHLSNVL